MDPADVVRKALCGSIRPERLKDHGLWEIETPFVDWKGEHVTVWIRDDKAITDAGSTLSEMRALRIYEAFRSWPLREDFLERYGITESDNQLVASEPSDPESVARYLQGLSKIVGLFESNPIRELPDRFPIQVRTDLKPLLLERAPVGTNAARWAAERLKEKAWPVQGVQFASDLNPVRDDVMIQVISHATQSRTPSDKMTHVASKLFAYEWVKKQYKVELVVVMKATEQYPPEARKMMTLEKAKVFEWESKDEREAVADLLASQTPSQRRIR